MHPAAWAATWSLIWCFLVIGSTIFEVGIKLRRYWIFQTGTVMCGAALGASLSMVIRWL